MHLLSSADSKRAGHYAAGTVEQRQTRSALQRADWFSRACGGCWGLLQDIDGLAAGRDSEGLRYRVHVCDLHDFCADRLARVARRNRGL
jgi:NAD(P)H-nitrite reductase large subunit